MGLVDAERKLLKMILLSPPGPNFTCPHFFFSFFFLPFRKLYDQSRPFRGWNAVVFWKVKKKKKKKARKRRKEGGRRQKEGETEKRRGMQERKEKIKGARERKYYAESFQIPVSGPSVKNIRIKWKATYLTHHGGSTSLAAAYKIIVGYSHYAQPHLPLPKNKEKKKHYRPKLTLNLCF